MIYRDKAQFISSIIGSKDTVLDVGFWGQGLHMDDPQWVHGLLKKHARDVSGIDLDFDASLFPDATHYQKTSAEDFHFGHSFDVIFAGDLIEHLSNPGLFLSACAEHMSPSSRLVLTTPNCFNLFNIAEKFTKSEPTVNNDHTCYFNIRTLTTPLRKNGWEVERVDYLYTLNPVFRESWKKKVLNVLYRLLSWWTPKYIETLVVTARYKK